MDANEIKYAKAKQCAQSSQQHGKSEVATIPPLSPTIIRQSTLLLRGTRNVPFIDDSDLPPDCPPPPPPGPPPESPPETPHTSPPKTPHTSPSDTPRASPQPQIMTGAPLASTSPSDMKSTQDVDTSKIESAEDDKDKAPPIPPKTSQLATTMSTTEPTQLISSVASSTTHSPTSTDVQPPISPETSQSPPSLPPKPSLQAVTPAPSETSVSDTHEQVSGKHSVQSSVSDERYEIPDTSIAPPPRPPPPKQTPTTTQVKDKTPEPYTAPSEADRYEVPEVPGEEVKTSKTTEVEERYEIPEVVKETSVAFGSNGGTSVSAKPSCTLL
ncbi:pollen-specific leucine-rich repeat extensin-like protein 2 isoform X2 [Homarus americanus]|uniref:pollen-specific leucine-rich repeat extensin-like protein 2 isoform X2 n=1 Tax=Homarus americanus TaxID=6706 RepID=UPI001C48B361|nr:pollen-specific leucine-rich repeat extensin-like protein 2 isoform X2 [Homarus americanus]